MKASRKKRILNAISIAVLVGIGVLIFIGQNKKQDQNTPEPPPVSIEHPLERSAIIGDSVEGRSIEAYAYGDGPTHLLFVGGIHGGYEWNGVALAYQLIDYLKAHPELVPKNLTIAIIPDLNPDGVYRVTKKEGRFTEGDVSKIASVLRSGRFNAHTVDLNRNFDCKWQPKSMWQNKTVSAGTKAFSEPEAIALRDFVLAYEPKSVIFWHSKANGVYASQCKAGILPKTLELMNTYANASGYRAIKTFDAYETSGDSEGWLASIGIPAITIEFKTHENVEWEENLAGIKAVIEYYRH